MVKGALPLGQGQRGRCLLWRGPGVGWYLVQRTQQDIGIHAEMTANPEQDVRPGKGRPRQIPIELGSVDANRATQIADRGYLGAKLPQVITQNHPQVGRVWMGAFGHGAAILG